MIILKESRESNFSNIEVELCLFDENSPEKLDGLSCVFDLFFNKTGAALPRESC